MSLRSGLDRAILAAAILGAIVGVAFAIVSSVLASGEAASHLRLHAISAAAIAAAVVAIGFRIRLPRPSVRLAMASGLAFGAAIMIEGIGAIGYTAAGERGSSLADLHDVGLILNGYAGLLLGVSVVAVLTDIAASGRTGASRVVIVGAGIVGMGLVAAGCRVITGGM